MKKEQARNNVRFREVKMSALGGHLNWSMQHFIMMQKDGVLRNGLSDPN